MSQRPNINQGTSQAVGSLFFSKVKRSAFGRLFFFRGRDSQGHCVLSEGIGSLFWGIAQMFMIRSQRSPVPGPLSPDDGRGTTKIQVLVHTWYRKWYTLNP